MNIVKNISFAIYRSFYIATALLRKKPDFLIIGVQKGGTTSLFHYLKQHPQIKLPQNKEVHFFDLHFNKGMLWYISWFPLKFSSKKFSTAEATPSYIRSKETAERIKSKIPDIKLIALLRNPVDRAYSHYQMEYRKKREDKNSFEAAIEDEYKYLSTGNELNSLKTNYLIAGWYEQQLKTYHDLFPSKNILVLKSEELNSKPLETLNKITEFLEISNWQSWKLEKRNVHLHEYPKLSLDTRKKLEALFLKLNKNLFNYTNGNVIEWF